MRFSKEKMIERLVKQGLAKEITPDVIEIMDKMDGKEVQEYNWRNVVFDENVGYISEFETYVNLDDCE